MNNNNNNNQSESSSLYDKLNNVHASLRKQKEDAFRTKQLAEQRLNIQRQDRETMERKAAETRSNLHSLKENATEMKNGNITLEVQSKGLEKEYNYGHADLQSKKEKLDRLTEKHAEEEGNQQKTFVSSREMLRRNRESNSSSNGSMEVGKNVVNVVVANMSTEEKRRRLEEMMSADGGEELCRMLPELIKIQRLSKEDEATLMEIRNASLRRIVAGYRSVLGRTTTAGNTVMMDITNMQGGGNVVIMQQ